MSPIPFRRVGRSTHTCCTRSRCGLINAAAPAHALTGDALEEWHRYSLPSFIERMTCRLRSHCEDGHQT
jgi:hypothetical protein